MSESATVGVPAASGWQRFWNNGGFWKALGLAVFYWLAYQGIAWVTNTVFDGLKTEDGTFDSWQNVLFGPTMPILLAGIMMFAIASWFGWVGDIFGRQPIDGRGWMWIAFVLVLGFNALRFAAVDYQSVGLSVTLATLFLGLCIGFTEELVCRGFAVQLLRRHGYGEWAVAMLSSLIFGLLHAGNFIGSDDVLALVITIVYTAMFGIMMYLAMRVTGTIWWAIVLHASTDPSLFLLSGGIADEGEITATGTLASLANLANPVVIIVGLILILFIRGRVGRAHYGLPEKREKVATAA